MGITEKSFGKTKKGQATALYWIENKKGMKIAVTDFGATLVSVMAPDKNGNLVDVVLGYDSVTGYEEGTVFFGATVGRSANRIGGASFEISGIVYELDKNSGGNNLHSGFDCYNQRVWKVKEKTEESITFLLHSADGDQGYPGTLDMNVTYTLTEDNAVRISYDAVPDKDTIINMTNHSYFNMNGHNSGDVLSQEVWIGAKYFTEADEESITTGRLLEVAGTPMDFNTKKAIGKEIEVPYEALLLGKGYDHNWVLNHGEGLRKAAEMTGDRTGITLEVYTDLPGMQFYTANFVENEKGKEEAVYDRRHGACFETQYFPDAVHKEHFASPICKAGEAYHTTTIFKFK